MRIVIGVLLIIIGCLALCAVIVVPVLPPLAENETIDTALAAILCKPNETFERELYQTRDRDGTGYSMTPYCVNSDHQREDVTGKWVLVGAGGFVVPFMIGLILTIWGANVAVRRRVTTMQGLSGENYTFVNTSGIPSSGVEFKDGVLKVGGMHLKMDNLNPDNMKAQMGVSAGGGDLTEKLRQIQEAKDNGLISSSEYDRMRQKILDEMS
ncbi:MAG: SHOCT domain-containing protein [Chloroflexi bacterium]|nr:SHOCT domain-containing protein [Chloroflexota bacterium]MCC6895093.1 SHOCT domain-containing protein [Anaerolineae bacterium]